jgi:3',5'-cyclic-AMP phosphodiesterase
MLIAQVTDLHLGFDRADPDELNARRLSALVHRLVTMSPTPDLVIVTGDLTEHGDGASYARVRAGLAALPCPVLLALGNHDLRDAFGAEFPDVGRTSQGFVQYVHDAGPLRVLVLDSLDEGRHGGAFCAHRADWLVERLAEAPDRPTLLVLHHPPVETGIPWLTASGKEPWISRLRDAVRGHDQIVGLACGHIHRSLVTRWAGLPLAVCSSASPQVALEMAGIDPDVPDGRPMIVADEPGFALHWWTGEALVTHFDTAATRAPLVRFDARMSGLVRGLLAELAPPA